MKKKILILVFSLFSLGSVLTYAISSQNQNSACPLEGTPECPKYNCPLKGTPDCPYEKTKGKLQRCCDRK